MQETYQAVIVEDDPMIASIDQNFLERDPRFRLAASFRSGQDALPWLLRHPADLLILDDLGTEFNSNFLITTLYSLLNNRLGAKLPTIVTTNVTDGSLLEKLYTEKISSRLSSFVPCRFLGEDIRTKLAQGEQP